MKDLTTVDEAVVDNSPPLTSSLFSRNSASSAQESAYLRDAILLRWSRLIVSVIVIIVAISIVGCLAHVLYSYNHTKLDPDEYLPLWPIDIDVKPTVGTIVPALLVLVATLVYTFFAVIPSPHSRILYQVMLFLVTSAAAFTAAFFAVLFNQLLLHRADTNSRETLQTWTCKFYNGARAYGRDAASISINIDSNQLIPVGFERICKESMAAQWMSLALLVLEVGCCCIAVWGFVSEQKIRRSRERRRQAIKCESEFA